MSERITTITAGELRKRHGQRVRLETNKGVVIEGHISVDKTGWVGVAHDNPNAYGGLPDDLLGHEYGWCLHPSYELHDYSDNRNYNWIELLDDKPRTEKATLVKTVYSDGVEIFADGRLTISGVTKTRTEWQDYQKQIRRALERSVK